MSCTLSHPIPAKYDAATEKGHVTQLCTFLQGHHTMITVFNTNMPTNMPTNMMGEVRTYAFQQGTVAALACATSVFGFRMKALVAYDPIFLRNILMPFLKRRNNCLNVTWALNLMDYSLDKCIESSLFSNNQIKIKFPFLVCLDITPKSL